jgi:hypothetical protein
MLYRILMLWLETKINQAKQLSWSFANVGDSFGTQPCRSGYLKLRICSLDATVFSCNRCIFKTDDLKAGHLTCLNVVLFLGACGVGASKYRKADQQCSMKQSPMTGLIVLQFVCDLLANRVILLLTRMQMLTIYIFFSC